MQPNGVYPPAWEIAGEGRDFRLSNILEPLEQHKNDLVVISNLENSGVRGHVQMTCAFLTGLQLQNGRCGISLDQLVAAKDRRPDAAAVDRARNRAASSGERQHQPHCLCQHVLVELADDAAESRDQSARGVRSLVSPSQ